MRVFLGGGGLKRQNKIKVKIVGSKWKRNLIKLLYSNSFQFLTKFETLFFLQKSM